MTDFIATAKDAGYNIIVKDGLIYIEGNWTRHFNKETGELNQDCPIQVTGGRVAEVTHDQLVIEKKKGLHIILKIDGSSRSIEYIW